MINYSYFFLTILCLSLIAYVNANKRLRKRKKKTGDELILQLWDDDAREFLFLSLDSDDGQTEGDIEKHFPKPGHIDLLWGRGNEIGEGDGEEEEEFKFDDDRMNYNPKRFCLGRVENGENLYLKFFGDYELAIQEYDFFIKLEYDCILRYYDKNMELNIKESGEFDQHEILEDRCDAEATT